MRRSPWIYFPLFFVVCHVALAQATGTVENLSSFLRLFAVRNRIPALTGVIVSPNSIDQITFGTRDAEGHVAFSQTPFLIGSVAKSMTALAIMQLRDAGRLQIDVPVHDYLPRFMPGSTQSAGITVRNLLTHTSGISAGAGDANASGMDEFVASLKASNLWRAPGTGFEYSNANYVLLGAVVAAVSGQSYDSYMVAHVFAPLQMTNTYTRREDVVANNGAAPFIWRFGMPRPAPLQFQPALVPAAYIFSSASDLSHYVRMLVNGGIYSGTTIVSPDSLKMMFQPAIQTPDGDSYGFGWYIRGAGNGAVVYHDGYIGEFSGTLVLQPGLHSGGAAFMNIDGLFATELLLPQLKDFLVEASSGKKPELPPQTVPSFYLGFMLVLGLSTAFAVLWFARALLTEHTTRFRIAPIVWELGGPLFLLGYMPFKLLGVRDPVTFWRAAATRYWDLASWCFAICAILLAAFLLRAIRSYRLASQGDSTVR